MVWLQIVKMSPPEVISRIEEAAGTRLYENKKKSALSTLARKEKQIEEIDQVGFGGGWLCGLGRMQIVV